MNEEEKMDVILRELYKVVDQNKGIGGIYPKTLFEENGLTLTQLELDQIIMIFEAKRLTVSQTSHVGVRIYFDSHNRGKEFVETNSFSQPGTSILDL